MTAITHNGLGIYAVPEAETLKLTQTLIGYCIYTLLANRKNYGIIYRN